MSPGELEFSAVLRPRGASGWRRLSVRTFVTIPVQVGFAPEGQYLGEIDRFTVTSS